MSTWSELVKTAIIGTGRTPLLPAAGDTPLDKLLAAAHTDSAEQTLLRQAGLITQYELAGQHPPRSDRPLVRPRHTIAMQPQSPLAVMFANRHKDLLPRYLELLAQANQTVSARYLPNLLNYGAVAGHQAHAVIDVLGTHGRWLAMQNPQWTYAAPATDEWEGARRLWHNPKLQRRQALMRQLRHRRPQLARELLASTWKTETTAVRLSLLRLLQINLTIADEPFLEAARADRNASVRREALWLLCCLPDSNLGRRMTQATRQLLRWDGHTQRLTVRFPSIITSSLSRDGVPIQLANKKLATLREEQLRAMLRAVPLDVWPQRLGVSAETLINAIGQSKWPRTITNGWIQAAQMQQHAKWGRLLINKLGVTQTTHKLVPHLTGADRDALARHYLAIEKGTFAARNSQLLRLLANQPTPWSTVCTDLWLDAFTSYLATGEKHPITHAISSSVRRFGRACPPAQIDRAITTLLPRLTIDAWRNKIQETINILRFRQEMHQSIVNGASV